MSYILQVTLHMIVLSVFYFAGTFIQQVFSIPFPGSLIGMLLLFVGFVTKVVPINYVDAGASLLLKHLSLLFVPIVSGIVTFPVLFTYQGFLLIAICVISTCLVILLSGLTSQALVKKKEGSM